MKKFLLCAVTASFLLQCAGTPKVQDTANASNDKQWITQSNAALAKHSLYDFPYKNSTLPDTDFQNWITASLPAVSEIIQKLPDGYVLQVTGHSDASGPEYPEGNRPGNIRISQDRAKKVRDALVAKGINPEKLTFSGAGTSELLSQYQPKSNHQRRVTFKVVPAK